MQCRLSPRDADRQQTVEAYDAVRALLAARGAHDGGIDRGAVEQILGALSPPASATLAAEAEHHGVAPLLAPMIAAFAETAADAAIDELNHAFVALTSRQRRAAAVREQCIDELLRDFADAEIRMLLLKGAALGHLIYTSPAMRPMTDIDLLVDATDAARAVAIAGARGFSFAQEHASRFAGRMHHLPVATVTRAGFCIALEVHLDAIAGDFGGGLTFADLTETPRLFRRGAGPDGVALGHVDMLRHLARHAFTPARRVRLIHLYDLWRYQARFRDEIDWQAVAVRFPQVMVVLELVAQVFAPPSAGAAVTPPSSRIGYGMVPMSEIAATFPGIAAKLDALFNPPAWWLRGFYGVAPGKSLLACRCLQHPATIARWLLKRLAAGLAAPVPTTAVAATHPRAAEIER